MAEQNLSDRYTICFSKKLFLTRVKKMENEEQEVKKFLPNATNHPHLIRINS